MNFKQLEKKSIYYTLEELDKLDIWQNFRSDDYCIKLKTNVVEPVLLTGIYHNYIETYIRENKVLMSISAEPLMLIEFKTNKFPLTGCELFTQFEGKYFKDLPEKFQDKLNNLKIEIVEYTNFEEVHAQKVLIQ